MRNGTGCRGLQIPAIHYTTMLRNGTLRYRGLRIPATRSTAMRNGTVGYRGLRNPSNTFYGNAEYYLGRPGLFAGASRSPGSYVYPAAGASVQGAVPALPYRRMNDCSVGHVRPLQFPLVVYHRVILYTASSYTRRRSGTGMSVAILRTRA